MRVLRFLSLAAAAAVWSGSALAQEIRVLDPSGLIRLVEPVAAAMQVDVEIAAAAGAPLKGAALTQTSGLADDRTAAIQSSRYIFANVPPGTWQIALTDPSERIKTVSIAK